ncbi:MAG: coatomer WD associated region-domain-containing protein [Monoraphidium minutum]|nr:MAG: coatomer WD associated region-domain-containing protein [Monoraphidium minutum]
MPLRLDVKKQLVQRTERVKGVDLHPTEPWLLANLYNGNVYLWNYNDSTLVKSFEVTELPVRTAKFVPRKQWIVVGADDMMVRVYNYNTMDKVRTFEAHTDYIRSVAVHPTLPYMLTSSDDMLIKLWDWDKAWACVQVFEGHSHYVMQVVFNPKDTNTFASASLDRTVKVWSLGQPTPNFTLEGHEKGVNCVDYFTGGDRPFLISGADDKLAKVWDYQTKACVQTLEGHSHNISCVAFHPELPIILTGSEDGSVKMWHATTYRLENTLNYGMERVWALGTVKGSNNVAFGFDEGIALVKIGREEPVASMDTSGKIIWARHNEIQTVNVKSLGAEYEVQDGERLPLAAKDLGACDLYPQSLRHNPNGRFVTVCGDGEYVVYTALAWRNKSFGSALEFAWSADSNEFAVREAGSRVKVFKNFAERLQLKIDFTIEGLHGGSLIGARSPDFVCFYDWGDGRLVRRIDVGVRDVIWSESGELVAIIGESSFYVLSFSRAALDAAVGAGAPVDEDGIEEAFELVAEVPERVRTGLWVGDCFIYTNAAWRLNYCVGGEVTTMYHLDRPMYLLGYLAAQSRVYLIDREFSVVSYTLLLSLVEFKTLVMREQLEAAWALLPNIPQDQLDGVARFLEAKGLVKEALEIARDMDYRFDLAIQLGDMDTAQEIADKLDTAPKWRQLGELAMSRGQLDAAATCLSRAEDLSGLLLLHAAQGNRAGLEALADQAATAGKTNVGFLCAFLLGDTQRCVSTLLECGRLPEAAMFARAYLPSKMSDCVKDWKADLASINAKAAEALADPAVYPNLFPGLEEALQQESSAAGVLAAAARQPAAAYAALSAALAGSDALAAQMAALGLDGAAAAALAPPPAANGGGRAAAAAEEAEEEEGAFGGSGGGYSSGGYQQQQAAPFAAAEEAEAEAEEEEEEEEFFHEPAPADGGVDLDDDWGLDGEDEAV